ncbi:NSFL1 cofactor p47 [Galleria mellonella]|uniref:NSFL1 cofactor p47 n=1 Tax=Galleria mellonella TaxID=7137 RepID=A0A6J1W7S3_GALME|nr:NSFL1 cofactor p47 [Galleria mellonella]
MSANEADTLRQFCDVTGVDEVNGRFYLESSNWQLEVALSSFYEHGGNVEEPAASAPFANLSNSAMDTQPRSPVKSQDKAKKKTTTSKFATLESLQQDSSSEDDEGQAFYAGGSERSGQQILGPGKGRKDIVTEMFKSVRERGAVVFEDEPSSASRGRGGLFSGVGYRLGQTADDHEQVAPSNSAQPQENSRSVRLQLYREGFTVDSGPLRHYTDPENAEFLNCIRRGEIPPSLGGSAGGGEVRVSLEDRRHEECPRPQHKPQAFAGKGHMLGSPTPPTAGATVTAGPADRAANLRAAQDALRLDDGQPTTTIQFRLADGSRLTGRFNHTHTVGELAEYVARAEPAYQLHSFALLTSYPTTELTDSSLTIAQANILNSTLLQRLK